MQLRPCCASISKTHRPVDWINSLRKESVVSSRLRKQTKDPPRPPQTKQGEDWKCTVHSCRGRGGLAGAWLVHVRAGAGKGLFWENRSLPQAPPPQGDPAPCLKVKKSSNSIAARKRVFWVEMLVFSPVFGFLLLLVAAWVSWVPGWVGPGGGWRRGPQLKRRLQAVDGAPWT